MIHLLLVHLGSTSSHKQHAFIFVLHPISHRITMVSKSNVQGFIRVRAPRDSLKSVAGVEVDDNRIKVVDVEKGKEESFE